METKMSTHKLSTNHHKKKRPKDDILDVVKEFISYFEETDRSENNDNRIKRS